MADKIELRAYPANRIDALTMLYLQNQDLLGVSPAELVALYNETHEKIKKELAKTNKNFSF